MDMTIAEELCDGVLKNGGGYTDRDFVMSYAKPFYVVKDMTREARTILQMNEDHYNIRSAIKAITKLNDRRRSL